MPRSKTSHNLEGNFVPKCLPPESGVGKSGVRVTHFFGGESNLGGLNGGKILVISLNS